MNSALWNNNLALDLSPHHGKSGVFVLEFGLAKAPGAP